MDKEFREKLDRLVDILEDLAILQGINATMLFVKTFPGKIGKTVTEELAISISGAVRKMIEEYGGKYATLAEASRTIEKKQKGDT